MRDVSPESSDEDAPRPWALGLVWVLFTAVVGCIAYDVFTAPEMGPSPSRAANVRVEGTQRTPD